MLLEHIENLRSRPREVRTRYAYIITTILTGVIIVVWLSVLFLTHYAENADSIATVEDSIDTDTRQSEDLSEVFRSSNSFAVPDGSTRVENPSWVQQLQVSGLESTSEVEQQ